MPVGSAVFIGWMMKLKKDPKTYLNNPFVFFAGVIVIIAFSLAIIRIVQDKYMSGNTPNTGEVFIVVHNSGSTNFPGFTITVNNDGSGTLVYDRRPADTRPQFNRADKSFRSQTFQIRSVRQILSQIGILKGLPYHSCIKSASFGSVTTITYDGQTSGDVSCIDSTDPQIYQDLKKEIDLFVSQVA